MKKSKLHTIIETQEDITKILERKRDKFKEIHDKLADCKDFTTVIYYILGGIQMICSVIASLFSGSKSLNEHNDSYMLAIFIFTIIVSILSTLLNFFKIESKMNEYKTSKQLYFELIQDIDEILFDPTTIEDYREFLKLLNEKTKFINSNKPTTFDNCCIGKKNKNNDTVR